MLRRPWHAQLSQSEDKLWAGIMVQSGVSSGHQLQGRAHTGSVGAGGGRCGAYLQWGLTATRHPRAVTECLRHWLTRALPDGMPVSQLGMLPPARTQFPREVSVC